MKKTNLWLALLVIVILSLFLTACGTSAPEVVERVVTKEVEKVVTQVVVETVVVEGTPQVVEKVVTSVVEVEKVVTATPEPAEPQRPVVIVQGIDPPSLDPQFNESGAASNIYAHMFDGLIGYDRDMNIVPEAAESYELLDDGVTWQFKIRQGIEFWNGEPLDAHAVKFTLDRMGDETLREQGLNDPYYGRVGFDHADVVDDYTINIVLKEPSVLFPVYTTFVRILAPGYYEEHPPEETAIMPMGSGPWMFEEWVKDDHITLVANPNYWLGKPEIETLIFRPVPESSVRTAMLETGEADIVDNLAPDDVGRIEAQDNLRTSIAVGGRRVHIEIPTENPIFQDRRVRQAMNYAVDFDTINETILGGLAYGRMAVPVNGDHWINSDIDPYPYDPDKAIALLEEAGWDPATEVIIYSPTGRYVKDKELGQIVAAYLQDVGINATHETLEWSVYSEKGRNSEWDMPWMIGWGSRFFGPDDLSIFFPGSGFQGSQWLENTERGPEAVELYQQMLGSTDEEELQQLVWEIQDIFVEEAPWIFLWKQVALFGVNKRIDWEGSGNTRIDLWLAGEDKGASFTSP